jgi:hypothetical protein
MKNVLKQIVTPQIPLEMNTPLDKKNQINNKWESKVKAHDKIIIYC